MLIVRELVAGHQAFNDIARGLPGIPRSLLTSRLRRLEQSGVLDRVPHGPNGHRYRLTAAGRELKAVVDSLGKWGARWAFEHPNEEDLDPGLLLWRMQHRLNSEALPEQRVTVEFDFGRGSKGRFWFVIEDGQASVCVTDPGFDIDVLVTADLSAFYQVWLGRKPLREAIMSREVDVAGSPSLERAFGQWFLWSPMAKFVSTVSSGVV